MQIKSFYKTTGAALLAMGMTIAPISQVKVQAQETGPDTEVFDTTAPDNPNLQEAEESLERAGQEALQGVEAAGEAAEQQINMTAQEAAQSAQEAAQSAQESNQEAINQAEEAAQRAEIAAEEAVDSVEQSSNWGWLGLFGLIGLFGLVGGNKRRVETSDRYYREPASTTTSSTTGEYRP